ncbi:hypothetical protein GCM10009526_31270 [Glutamicibacter creatinolyticus]
MQDAVRTATASRPAPGTRFPGAAGRAENAVPRAPRGPWPPAPRGFTGKRDVNNMNTRETDITVPRTMDVTNFPPPATVPWRWSNPLQILE